MGEYFLEQASVQGIFVKLTERREKSYYRHGYPTEESAYR